MTLKWGFWVTAWDGKIPAPTQLHISRSPRFVDFCDRHNSSHCTFFWNEDGNPYKEAQLIPEDVYQRDKEALMDIVRVRFGCEVVEEAP